MVDLFKDLDFKDMTIQFTTVAFHKKYSQP